MIFMFKIITIPFDRKNRLFDEEVLERFALNKKINAYRAEFFELGDEKYWTVFLDALDHFIKEKMGIKYYIRYMDDMVIFSGSKGGLKMALKTIGEYMRAHLKLDLNRGATFVNSRLNGLSFLGFRIFPNLIRIRRENLGLMKRRMRKRGFELRQGIISEERYIMGMRSMFEHISFADSLMLRRELNL
ncbi:MAG: RNA-directed DNA polymerase, partial [Deltaproteobacteria bacterium]|nr:RNA-directed DNA polymerase [Deltaproteobacteria bacterium]